MSEELTSYIIYYKDCIFGREGSYTKAVEEALIAEGRDPMATEEETWAYFEDLIESEEIGDWRIVEEDDLDILIDYTDEECYV